MTTETFFLPREDSRIRWSTPAVIYNLYRSLFIRNKNNPVFVPIRSMQFMAILDQHDINFVDSQSYAVCGDSGGRIILLAWDYSANHQRQYLGKPVPCEVVFFEKNNEHIQQRLVWEFKQSMALMDQRLRQATSRTKGINIVALKA
jgi:hypothetical protein